MQGKMIRRVVQADVLETVIVGLVRIFKIRRLKYRHADGALDARLRFAGVDELCFQSLGRFRHSGVL